MKILRDLLDKLETPFIRGRSLKRFFPLYEMIDTFLYTPGTVTKGPSHVRDGIDQKRMMITVVVALIPCILMALYNTGFQANTVLFKNHLSPEGWRSQIISILGMGFDPENFFDNLVHGTLYFAPVYLITGLAGGFWEAIFAIVRKHEINEGFLVTGMLFPLILPPTVPLWQVAIGISFGIVIGKEVFGGVGMNILNPALTARAFLFFAYPAQLTGESIWVAVEGFSKATPLAIAAAAESASDLASVIQSQGYQWWDCFFGFTAGSMGETSTLACLFGAVLLIGTGIGSWRIMLSGALGTISIAFLFNIIANHLDNPMFMLTPVWHFVLGGYAFGLVFMATDPVSAAMTETGKYIYGFLIGVLVVIVRVVNPAFPEGTMLAILFMN